MTSPKKQVTTALKIFGVIFLLLALYKAQQIMRGIAEGKKHGPPPAAVTTVIVHNEVWPITIDVTGSLKATLGITLSAENSGKVTKINFTPGQFVEKGTVLVELDTGVQEANFKAAQALADQAKLDRDRAIELKKRNVISQAELDSALARFNQLSSAATSTWSSLEHMKIIAPFSGTTGIRTVTIGEYINQGTPIVPLYNEETLYLDFSVPQRLIAGITAGKKVTFTTDAYPTKTFDGTITSVNPNINEQTRNMDVQATIRNPEKLLHSGMFAHIRVDTGETIRVVPVPASSISYAPYGDRLYVVRKENKDGTEVAFADLIDIKVGPKMGDQVGIISGLKGEEEVVTSGMFKIIPGVPLIINNAVTPSNEKKPTAENT